MENTTIIEADRLWDRAQPDDDAWEPQRRVSAYRMDGERIALGMSILREAEYAGRPLTGLIGGDA
jgi:hypothetical protein